MAALLVGAACGDDSGGGDGGLEVVASFYPLAEAARQVGGDRVDVTNLTASGVEPHDLELTTRQVDRIEDADVVLYLGGDFQPAVEELAERRDEGSVDVLDELGLPDADPHFWLDPVLMAAAVNVIRTALAEVDDEGAAEFGENARRYQAELDRLHQEFTSGLRECERRTIVTSHAAFTYLGARYQLRQQAIAGLEPESEPDPERIAELADLIRQESVTTVFYETLVDPDLAETLAREAGVRTAVLDPLEGPPENDTYTGAMRKNLVALVAALGCG